VRDTGLRIGIDGRFLQDHFPGIGRYTFHLIKELARLDGPETYVVFYNPYATNSRFNLRDLEGPSAVLWPVDPPPFSVRSQFVLWHHLRLARIELFHSPHYLLPLLATCPLVCTIHDTIPLRDAAYMPSRTGRAAYRLALSVALSRSKAVMADSSASREDLVQHFKIPPHRVRVVYLGVDPPRPGPGEAGESRCILYVGTNKPHKNLPRLILAYARSGLSQPLVIAGGLDPRFPEAQRQAEALGLGGRVRFLGYVEEDRLEKLYRSADLLVFPSLAEGFGLPALEAMSYGVPVVSSNHPSLPEVVGEAALLVDPLDIGSLASAMARVLTDRALALELSRRGQERVALFSWKRTAEGCVQVYREVSKGL